MLGKGAYGGVYLVKKKNSNDFFAMKVIDFSGKVRINLKIKNGGFLWFLLSFYL